jgi:hypothetical protein
VQCWFCSHQGAGIELYNSAIRNMTFIGCEISGNKGDGVRALYGQFAEFDNCRMAGNSGSGLTTIANMSRFRVSGCTFWDPGFGTNQYCVYINGGTYTAYEVTNNFFVEGYSLGGLVDGGSATHKAIGSNLG